MADDAGRTVAVVDDDEVVRDSLKALLETRRFSVVDFESGEAFLKGRNGAELTCLILDIHMPGMTGVEVLRKMRETGDRVPVILITGRRDPTLETQARSLGALVLLDKPISHVALFQAIQKASAGGTA
jgi:two-component system, LuxR family, response regulator FixJ